MADSDLSTEQSMDEVLKKIERKLVEEDTPPSAEVLKLSDADNRKGRAQNRARPSPESSRAAGDHAPGAAPAEEIAAMAAPLDEPATGSAETLEDVVRELVKPMLRSWLDAKLGDVLNHLVQAELSKALEEVQPPPAEAASR
jgi:cell pole-organizing protein PopZ